LVGVDDRQLLPILLAKEQAVEASRLAGAAVLELRQAVERNFEKAKDRVCLKL